MKMTRKQFEKKAPEILRQIHELAGLYAEVEYWADELGDYIFIDDLVDVEHELISLSSSFANILRSIENYSPLEGTNKISVPSELYAWRSAPAEISAI